MRFGLLGEHLPHTLSPELHSELFRLQGMDASYDILERSREEVGGILDEMKEKGITGINVTIPYKETLYNMVDVLDSHAREIGAINTVHLKDGVTYGYNTDFVGTASMLKKAGVTVRGKKAVILGSGGASRAVIYALYTEGASDITVAARNEAAKAQLKQQFPYIHTCTLDDPLSGDILVNTTPVGMYPYTGISPVPACVFKNFSVAADIVYNPLKTEFLLQAEKAGLATVTGLMMLVDQAVAAEEIWLNKPLDYAMGDKVHDKLKERFL